MNEEDKIKKALLKKALGYSASETVEEYSVDEEGNRKLSKKKVTKKHFSPDIAAVKVLLERYYKTYEEKILSMSDEELEDEKRQLQQLLKGEKGGDKQDEG
ncbi:MAG: hypothetical protein J6A28_04730 [Clostridia bacterium]|nr:hypothetical protein [Clostridia bacterium]